MMAAGVDTKFTSARIPNGSAISLVNLLNRHTPIRIKVVQLGEVDPDPELFIVTRVDWRDLERPLMAQLPKVLSYLETMRGTKGVPDKVYLDSAEGLQLYIPSGKRASEIPDTPRVAVKFLRDLAEDTIRFIEETSREVEDTFWRIAMKRGYNPDIIDKMETLANGYDSPGRIANLLRFRELMEKFFSLRFRIHSAERMLHLEE